MQHILMRGRKSISGCVVGSIQNHQEVLDFCATHNILPDCEMIEASQIDWAWDKLNGATGNADGVRYVIDVKKSLANNDFVPK